uniref:hypothetical protein n=1 Tax=Anaerosporobacter sp. TaxID=1872529 RepID=UPI00286F5AFD
MEFKEMTCPFCKGELKIPEELSTCICMYCGKKIEIANTGKLAENCLEYEKFCDIAMNEGASIVLNHLNLMKSFKANLYEDAFKRYLEVCMATIQALDRACGKLPYIEGGQLANSKYKAETEQQLIELWVMRVLDDMEENCKIKRAENGKVSNSRKVDELRFIMALYTVPMIRETKLEAAEAIAELITKEWESRYPLQKFSKADYAEIRDGFRKIKLCFITTPTGDYLVKTHNCL